uniref:Uncharacterized protein n=1 Tax=Vespula pensylvanica TaxID=30213 RepID=A0A834KA47_VESPE|nr:hypothetical protein H0235_015332 [Vespula pensylvanica]
MLKRIVATSIKQESELIFACKIAVSTSHHQVPVAQRIARWTSNPKVVGSIPTRDVGAFTIETSPILALVCTRTDLRLTSGNTIVFQSSYENDFKRQPVSL